MEEENKGTVQGHFILNKSIRISLRNVQNCYNLNEIDTKNIERYIKGSNKNKILGCIFNQFQSIEGCKDISLVPNGNFNTSFYLTPFDKEYNNTLDEKLMYGLLSTLKYKVNGIKEMPRVEDHDPDILSGYLLALGLLGKLKLVNLFSVRLQFEKCNKSLRSYIILSLCLSKYPWEVRKLESVSLGMSSEVDTKNQLFNLPLEDPLKFLALTLDGDNNECFCQEMISRINSNPKNFIYYCSLCLVKFKSKDINLIHSIIGIPEFKWISISICYFDNMDEIVANKLNDELNGAPLLSNTLLALMNYNTINEPSIKKDLDKVEEKVFINIISETFILALKYMGSNSDSLIKLLVSLVKVNKEKYNDNIQYKRTLKLGLGFLCLGSFNIRVYNFIKKESEEHYYHHISLALIHFNHKVMDSDISKLYWFLLALDLFVDTNCELLKFLWIQTVELKNNKQHNEETGLEYIFNTKHIKKRKTNSQEIANILKNKNKK